MANITALRELDRFGCYSSFSNRLVFTMDGNVYRRYPRHDGTVQYDRMTNDGAALLEHLNKPEDRATIQRLRLRVAHLVARWSDPYRVGDDPPTQDELADETPHIVG